MKLNPNTECLAKKIPIPILWYFSICGLPALEKLLFTATNQALLWEQESNIKICIHQKYQKLVDTHFARKLKATQKRCNSSRRGGSQDKPWTTDAEEKHLCLFTYHIPLNFKLFVSFNWKNPHFHIVGFFWLYTRYWDLISFCGVAGYIVFGK